MTDPKREEIKARIAAAQAREQELAQRTFAERASDTASDACLLYTSPSPRD